MVLALGDDDEPGQAGQVHDGARDGPADARGDARAQRDLAVAEVVHGEGAVGGEAGDAAGGHDARAAGDVGAPEDAARRAVERPHLAGGADDHAVAAEVGRAQVDPGTMARQRVA